MAAIRVTRDKGYNAEARRILALPSVQENLTEIAERIKANAGEGHAIKKDRGGKGRVRVQVFTASNTAKVEEASNKTLTKAFAAERKQPRRYL